MSWKESVASVSFDKLFPSELRKRDLSPEDEINLNRDVLSNLPLQMSLYFNVWFAPFWLILLIIFLYNNYENFNEIYQIISIIIIVVLIIVETLRLYCGYEGNLRDKVPELAAFWMLSMLLQFPLQLFVLFNPFITWHPFQMIAQSIMVTMLSLQLIFGYKALRNISSHQVTYYRILKLKSEINITEKQRRYKAD